MPLAVSTEDRDRAFIALTSDITGKLESLALLYPDDPHRTAVDAMRKALLALVAAATAPDQTPIR